MNERAPDVDPLTAAIIATLGVSPDRATTERIARLVRYLLDDDPALSMRLGPYKMDTPRAAVQAAVTTAALVLAIEGAGLDSVPVVVLASVLPFLVDIERVELTPGDELVVAALRATAPPGGDDHDWYLALPPEVRAQLTQIEFLNLLGRLRNIGVITAARCGGNQIAGEPQRLQLRLPWRKSTPSK
jgi:hypothetical protein